MKSFVAHLDETDNMLKDRLLGLGGIITPGDRLLALSDEWERRRMHLLRDGQDEIKWNSITWAGRQEVAQIVVAHEAYVVADMLVDAREPFVVKRRPARDHYRVALRWAIGKMATLATAPPDTGFHQVVVDRVPQAKLKGWDKFDDRLNWARGRGGTYAQIEYAALYRKGNGSQGIPALRDRGFYPSLLESDATYNALLELADVVAGGVTRWAAAGLEGNSNERLTEFARILAPSMVLPTGGLACDIFCPNWERSPYWDARRELLRAVREWARAA